MPVDVANRALAVAAAAFLALAPARMVLAQAPQPAPPSAAPESSSTTAPPPTSGAAPAKRSTAASRIEAHIKRLHDQLHITPQQSSQWDAVASIMRENAETLEPLYRQRMQNASKMTAVDDLRSYEAIAEAHADGLKKLTPAFADLYASMSDAQKKNADALFGHRTSRTTHPHG